MRTYALLTMSFAGLLFAGCFFDDECDDCVPYTDGCVQSFCGEDECGEELIVGEPAPDQIPGDCKVRQCTGDEQPVEQVDGTDAPDDGNPCTEDLCDASGPVFVPLPTGTPCGEAAFCSPEGYCLTCDDGNPCTTEECTGGELVVTSTLPVGTACGEGLYCDATGACIGCDDGDACTDDDCSTGTPVHTPKEEGAACGEGGFCQASVCVTWCLPLPDPTTCIDDGAYEATDDTYSGEPQYDDDDDGPKPLCGVLTEGDVDWVSYHADDTSFQNDINNFQFWSYDSEVRFCAFAQCDAGTTSAPCYDGGIPTTGPEGQPGCCWQGVFNSLAYFSMNLECDNTTEDSGWVRIRIDNPSGGCAPWAFLDYDY